jgi:CarD family transcriptional regulator
VFIKGEYVVSGSKGVCVVGNVTRLDISGVDKEREYYILKPVYMAGSTIYVPVDTAEESMRKVLNREEVQQLICRIPEIQPISTTNDKLLEQEYRSCMKSNCCEEVIRVIKTIYLRKQKRLAAGRKVTAVDSKYFRIAEENLYGELAISLDMSRADVERYITEELDKHTDSPVGIL